MTLSPSDITWLTDELIVTLQKQEHLKPYTMEEINAILDEAERDFEAGLGIDGDDVHRELEEEFAREDAEEETRNAASYVEGSVLEAL